MDYIDLKKLTLDELAGVIHLYPWYGGARKELCRRMVRSGGEDWGKSQYADEALYVGARHAISELVRSVSKVDCSDKDIAAITAAFASIPAFYVADGHHRTAAAARVGAERRDANPAHNGSEEYNYFMAVVFPQSQLKIMDYNRVVKDLASLSPEEFIEALRKDFVVEEAKCSGPYRPCKLHNFSMYLGGKWYSLDAKEGTYDDNDPIGQLDVTVLSNLVLDKILHIGDLRTSKRIDFVGGIRGLGELQRRVDSGEMAVAFALYPVSMDQLVSIADTGNIMPPKTTWFEPKLRSGITIHKF